MTSQEGWFAPRGDRPSRRAVLACEFIRVVVRVHPAGGDFRMCSEPKKHSLVTQNSSAPHGVGQSGKVEVVPSASGSIDAIGATRELRRAAGQSSE